MVGFEPTPGQILSLMRLPLHYMSMDEVKGIEPLSAPPKDAVLPLDDTSIKYWLPGQVTILLVPYKGLVVNSHLLCRLSYQGINFFELSAPHSGIEPDIGYHSRQTINSRLAHLARCRELKVQKKLEYTLSSHGRGRTFMIAFACQGQNLVAYRLAHM